MKMRLVDGFVADISEDPAGSFHPSIAAEFIDVPGGAPADLRPGYGFVGGVWTAPIEPAPPPVEPAPPASYRTRVSRNEYYGLFRPDEEALIRIVASEPVTAADLKAADAAERTRLMRVASLAVMLRRTDALTPDSVIDLADHQVEAGLDLIAAMDLLGDGRPAEIKRGVPA